MCGDQMQYPLILGGGPQPGANRHPRWPRDRFHATPPTQPLGRHHTTIPNHTDKTPNRDQP